MAKIRIIQPSFDQETKEQLKVGDIVDKGAKRNKSAVDRGIAKWVDPKLYEKEIEKNGARENGETVNMSEKVEAAQTKKKTSVLRGKTIETKDK